MLIGFFIFIILVVALVAFGNFLFFTPIVKIVRNILGVILTFQVFQVAGFGLAFVFGLFWFIPVLWLFVAAFIYGYKHN